MTLERHTEAKPTEFPAAAASVALSVARAAAESASPVGLEIYSLRREMAKDISGTLAAIRRMGFEEVEVPGLYGLTARDFRSRLDEM